MKCKKVIRILLAVNLILALTACQGGGNSAQSNLTGTPEEILNKLNEDIAAAGVQMPMTLPPLEVTADTAKNTIGLSDADFEKYVTTAASSLAAIGTFAHQLIVIEAKDSDSAAKVKNLVSGEGGYDPKKWVCVYPKKVIVVESGNYVLLVAASVEVCDAAVEAFKNAAGNIGEVNTIFEGPSEENGEEDSSLIVPM